MRYQGVDWRNTKNWGCNEQINPFGQDYLDGGHVEAMEVMFVKVKEHLLDRRWDAPVKAQLYDEWTAAAATVRMPRCCMLLALCFGHDVGVP